MNCNVKSLLSVCKHLATAILENGGETYRAEECIIRLCNRFGIEDVDVMAFPTGVVITVRDEERSCYSETCRVKRRSFDLRGLNSANEISRRVIDGEISLFEAEKIFCVSRSGTDKSFLKWINLFAGGLSSAFFTVLFGGKVIDFFAALICGLAVQLFLLAFKKIDAANFISNFLASVLAAVVAVLIIVIYQSLNLSLVIIGAIMPLLPGLPMTNAIRDTINGDLISGISRLGEVLLIAVCLASGAGIVISGYYSLGGTFLSNVADFGFVLETVQALLFCFLSTLFFSLLLSAPSKSLVPSALIAAVGYYAFFIFDYFHLPIMLGGFLGTLFIAVMGEVLARVYKMPATIFVFPAVIPLVPGIWLYETMLFLVQGDYANFATKGTETVFFAGVMAGAIAVTNFIFRVIPKKINKG